jgi:hypothetical protein
MSAARAARVARGALLGSGTLSEDDVRTRVRTRFPAAEPLPPRPELDELLGETAGLEWFDGEIDPERPPIAPGFRIPPLQPIVAASALGSSGTRYRTGTRADVADEARVIAESAQDRLERHAHSGGYLVLTVTPARHERAISALSEVGATPVSLDALVVAALHSHAASKKINWDKAILATDAAGPNGDRWTRLLSVVRDATVALRGHLLHGPEHVLLTYPGLLARYDLLGLLDELRECTTRQPEPGQTLRTLWVLVPADDPSARPALAGKAVPVTTGAEHLALPNEWIENIHRTSPTSAGAAS